VCVLPLNLIKAINITGQEPLNPIDLGVLEQAKTGKIKILHLEKCWIAFESHDLYMSDMNHADTNIGSCRRLRD
jgi:hypothetical protein